MHIFCVYTCVSVCKCMYTYVSACERAWFCGWGPEEGGECPSIVILFRRGRVSFGPVGWLFSSRLEASQPQSSPCLHPCWSYGFRCVWNVCLVTWILGSKFWSSRLYSKCSYWASHFSHPWGIALMVPNQHRNISVASLTSWDFFLTQDTHFSNVLNYSISKTILMIIFCIEGKQEE